MQIKKCRFLFDFYRLLNDRPGRPRGSAVTWTWTSVSIPQPASREPPPEMSIWADFNVVLIEIKCPSIHLSILEIFGAGLVEIDDESKTEIEEIKFLFSSFACMWSAFVFNKYYFRVKALLSRFPRITGIGSRVPK